MRLKLSKSPSCLFPLRDIEVAGCLFYLTLCLEMRIIFRILEGLLLRLSSKTITSQDLVAFYTWFEGFFGVVTSILRPWKTFSFPVSIAWVLSQ